MELVKAWSIIFVVIIILSWADGSMFDDDYQLSLFRRICNGFFSLAKFAFGTALIVAMFVFGTAAVNVIVN